jgi:crotonobetainyl-CoA:carnitine CoA-transferase CaiB-like acyl-CoA transferase
MGRPDLAMDARFADVLGRHRNQTDLDIIVGEWTATKPARDVADLLSKAAVPASPVNGAAMLYDDPHLRARGFYEMVAHAVAGAWEVDGMPYHYSLTPAHIRLPPPAFAEHNDYVLRDLLSLSEADIDVLRAEGVVGSAPARAGQA